jgi:hypothetical protein
MAAIAAGDLVALGGVYAEAQAAFDRHAGAACPEQLTAPKLHAVGRCRFKRIHTGVESA